MDKEEENFEDETLNENEEDLDIPEDAEDKEDFDIDDDTPNNPMGLAHQISKESETVKHFKELPREVKYSFLDTNEKADVKHFARTYRNFKYIEKIIDLRTKEDENKLDLREQLRLVKNETDLVEYFINSGRDYLITDLDDLTTEQKDKLIQHSLNIKPNHMQNMYDNEKNVMRELYEEYEADNDVPEYIDDIGNIGKIMDTSVSSMGYKGNASQASVMTIQAVKNEDIQKQAESKTRFSFLDAIKNKLG